MDEAESRDLLELLYDQVEEECFVYEHRWRVGDLVVWDNRCLVHARMDFDPSELLGVRTCVLVLVLGGVSDR